MDIVKALERAIATASNDDYSKPGTVERERHVERLSTMRRAAYEIERLREAEAEARLDAIRQDLRTHENDPNYCDLAWFITRVRMHVSEKEESDE